MYSTITAGALQGMKAYLVQVEVDVSRGLPGFSIVGSISGEVREARERVIVALKNTGFDIPPAKITVNLAPAHRKKIGTAFDLPIAVGLMESMGFFDQKSTDGILFLGELGLNGEVKPVKGVLPIVREAARRGICQYVVPKENVLEGAVIPGVKVRGVEDIRQLLYFLQDMENRERLLPAAVVDREQLFAESCKEHIPDFGEVVGQDAAKRAAEIAAAGFHNLLLIGPPGAGKSMIAKRLPSILPPLEMEECLDVSAVYSVAGLLKETQPLIIRRPFQNPHHTITQTALTGGGSIPRPGAISLAHRGVLFLDELPEFQRSTLDCLRQPLEEHEVRIARSQENVTFPADFICASAMNPCPCGYYPDKNRCTCSEQEVKRYQGKVSGPVLDRMDLCVEILPVDITHLNKELYTESSYKIRKRVIQARERQQERYRGTSYHFNAEISPAQVETFCSLGVQERRFIESAYEKWNLSMRAYHRILKVARTIADLDGSENVEVQHLSEAVGYRMADKHYWNK